MAIGEPLETLYSSQDGEFNHSVIADDREPFGARRTDFDGLTIRYRRDRAGREAERLLADGARIASFHDRSGLLVRQEAWQPDAVAPEVTRYYYDGRGLLAGAENDASRRLERDGVGRITAETANGWRLLHVVTNHLGTPGESWFTKPVVWRGPGEQAPGVACGGCTCSTGRR